MNLCDGQGQRLYLTAHERSVFLKAADQSGVSFAKFSVQKSGAVFRRAAFISMMTLCIPRNLGKTNG